MTPVRAGRAEASAAIWIREKTPGPRVSGPTRPRLRGSLQALAGGSVALLLAFWLDSPILGSVVGSLATLVLLAALLSPRRAYALIDRAFERSGVLLGRAVAWVLMPLLFYAVFVPFGVVTRRGRRDPMKRFYEPDAPTYWVPHDASMRAGSESRVKQF